MVFGNFMSYDCTTDPGTHWVENILSKDGVAILKDQDNIEVLILLENIKVDMKH